MISVRLNTSETEMQRWSDTLKDLRHMLESNEPKLSKQQAYENARKKWREEHKIKDIRSDTE